MAIEGVLLDLAGVLYDGDRLLPGALRAIETLRERRLPIRFVTNTTRSPKSEIIGKLSRLGLTIAPDELFTPVAAARAWLGERGYSPKLLVHPALEADFAELPAAARSAVVIGDAEDRFTYRNLNAVFRAVIAGAPLLALARNRTFKDDDGGLSLDAGPFVAALEFASGVEATILGKPSVDFFSAALASIPCPAARAVMVGDDAESDIAGARRAGIGSALLVRTGKYRRGDEVRYSPPPTDVVPDIAAAADWIVAA